MAKIIKEIIIILLLCLVTMLLLAVSFYKFVPNKKAVPEITEYVASSFVQELLDDDIDMRPEKEQVVSTYEVTASDLKNYQKANTYVPGKANPFAAASKSVDGGGEGGGTQPGDDNEKKPNPEQNKNTITPEMPTVYQPSGTK